MLSFCEIHVESYSESPCQELLHHYLLRQGLTCLSMSTTPFKLVYICFLQQFFYYNFLFIEDDSFAEKGLPGYGKKV